MSHSEITLGTVVDFYPSERKQQEFKNPRKVHPAIVTEVNDKSVDLTVFGIGETVFAERVPFVDDAKENRSHWNFRKNQD